MVGSAIMGTNYFIYDKDTACPECLGTGHRRVHVGKFSWGWAFLFSNYLNSFKKWCTLLKNNKESLVDEFIGRIINAKDKMNYTQGFRETLDEDEYRISDNEDFC